MPTPSIGRLVHYVSYGTPVGEFASQCRAAIITEVAPAVTEHDEAGPIEDTWDVGLCVLNPTGQFFNQHVPYDQWDQTEALLGARPKGGTWHWPERVE
jgi:hypothetical protein